MQWFRLTDDQLINRIRTAQRHRRTAGVLWAVLGVGLLMLCLFLALRVDRQFNWIDHELHHGEQLTSQQLNERAVDFYWGAGLGLGFAVVLYSSAGLILLGLTWMLPNRRDRLLLKCWDACSGRPPAMDDSLMPPH